MSTLISESTSFVNCHMLKLHNSIISDISKVKYKKVWIKPDMLFDPLIILDLVIGIQLPYNNKPNRFELKTVNNYNILTQTIKDDQPTPFYSFLFPSVSVYNTKVIFTLENNTPCIFLTIPLPKKVKETLIKIPQQYRLPNNNFIMMAYGDIIGFKQIKSSNIKYSNIYKINNYLSHLYYAKKIKKQMIKSLYPVKIKKKIIHPALLYDIIKYIDDEENQDDDEDDIVENYIEREIKILIPKTTYISCARYNSDEEIKKESADNINTLIINLSNQSYKFKSRSLTFTLNQGDGILLNPNLPYKLIYPINCNKYIMEIRY